MPRKRGPGRPRLGAEARSVVVPVRLTKAQYKAIAAYVAKDATATVSGWVRDRCASVARIEVDPDGGDWHWVAYSGDGRPLGTCGIVAGPKLEDRVLQAAREHGLIVGEDVAVEISAAPCAL